MRKFVLLLIPLLFLTAGLQAADKGEKGSKDFKLVYRSSAGALEKATKETIEVVKGTVTVHRDAEVVGAEGAKTPYDKVYKISDEQYHQLYQIIASSGFLTWPKNSEGPHQSTVEEVFEITVDGKTVTHGRWEQGNESAFRSLYDQWNNWFNGIRTVRF